MDVLIVDDHPVVYETLSAVARAAIPEANVHVEQDLSGATARAAQLADPLVLLDLGLPGCSGIEALVRFQSAHPSIPVVVVSAAEDSTTVNAAIKSGAAGYIPKTTSPVLMVAALKVVASGGTYLPAQVMKVPATPEPARHPDHLAQFGLTERQKEVTIKQHAHAVYRALGVASRTEAFVVLARLGLRIE